MKKQLEVPHDPMEDRDDETDEYNPPPRKNLSRSVRRHYSEIMKRRATRLGLKPKDADHLASCSCWMCGNERKYFKKRTRQERLSILRQNDDS